MRSRSAGWSARLGVEPQLGITAPIEIEAAHHAALGRLRVVVREVALVVVEQRHAHAVVRLAAVLFVGSAADVVLAQGSKLLPFPPPVLVFLREARASWFKHFAAITMYRAHVAGGGAGRAEGDECEEVPRHGAARIEAALLGSGGRISRSYGFYPA